MVFKKKGSSQRLSGPKKRRGQKSKESETEDEDKSSDATNIEEAPEMLLEQPGAHCNATNAEEAPEMDLEFGNRVQKESNSLESLRPDYVSNDAVGDSPPLTYIEIRAIGEKHGFITGDCSDTSLTLIKLSIHDSKAVVTISLIFDKLFTWTLYIHNKHCNSSCSTLANVPVRMTCKADAMLQL
ncbi:unnamed protein product [Owenia fusiformis]|uniref:Uncharacterized protein n=1 Tax=Owenia fusiformis TaxID=6347 RepID=A0A8J1TF62_OWEFU|nr:unnamed protein product [Owenia fusiformis]